MKKLHKYGKWMMTMLAGAVISLSAAGGAQAAQARWEFRDNGWYYYYADGTPGNGWVLDKGYYYYLGEGGQCLMDCVTPDGYYVNHSGAWYVRTVEILETEFEAAGRFPAVGSKWTGIDEMKELKDSISFVFGQRRIRITEEAIEYLAGEDEEKVLLGIYKDIENGCYRLDMGINLDKSSTKMDKAATYDYAIFRAMLYQVTSSPELLEDAVYGSWEENNRWNINRTELVRVGDALVKYTAGSGYGHYYIYPAK